MDNDAHDVLPWRIWDSLEPPAAPRNGCSVSLSRPGDDDAHAKDDGCFSDSAPQPPPDVHLWQLSQQVMLAFLRGYGESTARTYAFSLRRFVTYAVGTATPPLAFNRVQLEGYVQHLQHDVGLAPKTVGRHLATLAGYFAYAYADELIPRNPMLAVRRPRQPSAQQSLGLTPAELNALMDAADAHSPRAAALVAVLALTGLRIGELLGANADDVHTARNITALTVRRKGGRVMAVPLPGRAELALRRYLDGRATGPLIASRTGRRLDRSNARRLLQQVATTTLGATRAVQLHPHVLRHAFVAALLDAGTPLVEVQAAANHATPTTTVMYDRARAELSAAHPTFHLEQWLRQSPAR